MTTVDYGNQIINQVRRYLPYTGNNISNNFTALSFVINSNVLTMTLSAPDYTIISSKINDAISPNTSFSISNIHLKNNITEFSAYPDVNAAFAFEVNFQYRHKFLIDQNITLTGFGDAQYNTTYRVLRIINGRKALLVPTTTVVFADVTANIGYNAVEFYTGFNGIQQLTDLGSNQVSFTFDENLLYTSTDINNLDATFLPIISDTQDNIKLMNFNTFQANLVNQPNTEYLVLDSSSLVGSPVRSANNTSDSDFSTFSSSGFFEKQYSINFYYILQRDIDDANNQTGSGSDISDKQVEMFEALTSIIRRPLDSGSEKLISSITIADDSVPDVTSEGRAVILYELNFVVNYLSDVMLNIDNENVYPIDSLKINENELNLS